VRSSAPEDLQAELEELERPTWHLLEARDVPLLGRLYATASLHRLLPARVAVRMTEWAARIVWRLSAARRRKGIVRAEAVLGPSAPSAAMRELGRRELIERWASGELFWRPWETRRTPLHGLEHLAAARARGRGVIVVTTHQGPGASLIRALAAHGTRLYVARFRKVRDDPIRVGSRARWTQANVRWIEEGGGRLVGRGGSYGVFRALLERNEVCWMAFDIPGDVDTEMCGRRFRLASGISALARETGAQLVPGFALRRGHRAVCWLEAPIDPATFAGTAELHRHLAEVVGRVLLGHPEQGAPQIELLAAARRWEGP
jgi:KDO2-lipid IV(A) lauroyltransferase